MGVWRRAPPREDVMTARSLRWLLAMFCLAAMGGSAQAPTLVLPAASPNAKAGEIVLAPNTEDGQIVVGKTYAAYHYTVVSPGAAESRVKNPFRELTMPNALLAPIPPGGTVAVGDIVLTWWQSGSGMQRAIVVNASDPHRPVVRYLDIEWKNPVKNKAGVPIGQMDEQLKADSFVKITADWSAGTNLVTWDEKMKKYTCGRIMRVVGDQVMVLGFAGRMYVWPKADCIALPVRPRISEGEEIWVPFAGHMTKARVQRVEAAIGRIFTEKGDVYSLGHVAPLPLLPARS